MTKWIFIVYILLSGEVARCQDKSFFTYEVSDIGHATAGDTITIQIKVNLLPGWFIYAPTAGNRFKDVQLFSIKFPSIPNLIRSLGEMKMPEPRLHKSYDVFMDEGNTFSQQFIISKSASEGKYNVIGHLNYQACNSSVCYPPVTKKIEIEVNVAK